MDTYLPKMEEQPKSISELKDMLEKLREDYKNAGGEKREIIKRQARAIKLALGEE